MHGARLFAAHLVGRDVVHAFDHDGFGVWDGQDDSPALSVELQAFCTSLTFRLVHRINRPLDLDQIARNAASAKEAGILFELDQGLVHEPATQSAPALIGQEADICAVAEIARGDVTEDA